MTAACRPARSSWRYGRMSTRAPSFDTISRSIERMIPEAGCPGSPDRDVTRGGRHLVVADRGGVSIPEPALRAVAPAADGVIVEDHAGVGIPRVERHDRAADGDVSAPGGGLVV